MHDAENSQCSLLTLVKIIFFPQSSQADLHDPQLGQEPPSLASSFGCICCTHRCYSLTSLLLHLIQNHRTMVNLHPCSFLVDQVPGMLISPLVASNRDLSFSRSRSQPFDDPFHQMMFLLDLLSFSTQPYDFTLSLDEMIEYC